MSDAFDCLAGAVIRLFAANQQLTARLDKLENAAPRHARKPKAQIAKTAPGSEQGALDVDQKTVSRVLAAVTQNGGDAETGKPDPAPPVPQPEKPVRLTEDHPLRKWRRAHDVTLDRMAEWTAATKATISRIETSQQFPQPDLLAQLVKLTGIDADAFLNRVAAGAAE